ncbi:MAG TPA: penicillin-binding transpeptidase domain-containing protein [Capillimicrobium sp.]|nr:penicillin-binding transpeptidase domain-containing protein [Capillimicrobium sp.]
MNTPARRVYLFITLLFAILVFATTWWSVARPESLRDNTLNKRALLEEQRIKRGNIRAADGTLLAHSIPGEAGTWLRRYTTADQNVAHAIGYSYTNLGRAGLERSRNDFLIGDTDELTDFVDELIGREPVGENVVTTLDLDAQQVALDQLAGRNGAVVAIEPDTGRVKVMASYPGFDANSLRDPDTFKALNQDPEAPMFNRATQASYPPGSTFKVVTAAAALDSGKYTPDSVVDGSSPKTISGVPLANSGGVSYGPISLTTALTNSVNTVWAQVGESLGKETMAKYMERFGFYAKPPLDYPADQMLASGEYADGKLLDPESDAIDVGRMAIGQDKLQVTPLQMAMVAAVVANGGELVAPRLTERVVDPDGRTSEKLEPETVRRVISPETAAQLGQMMTNVVNEGTGTAAALSGISVAGKTGTAEKNPATDLNQPWFIAFAPADDPQIAIAVTIESSIGGQGGTVAAPVAKAVLEQLLGEEASG